jgi:hypothetical protein
MTLAFGFGQDLRRETPALNLLSTWTAKVRNALLITAGTGTLLYIKFRVPA